MYKKTTWYDQDVENPRTYDFNRNSDGTYTLTDAFGEVTELGTPVNAENMNNIEEGVYNALTRSHLTNCILQAPKPPDLSITDGVLTLKAGVEVIVPYGTSAPELSIGDSLNGGTIVDISWDESKLFYIIQYDKDKTDKVAYTCSNLYLFLGTGANLFEYDSSYITSGSTAPAVFTSAGYAMWYDTDENYVKITTDNGSNWTAGVSFPIGRASSDAGSGYTNILETFSASGFIDKTVWVNKEVTFLLSNGRNDDGTLKNTEYTTGQIYTDTITSSTNNNHTFTFTLNEEYPIIRDPIYYEQTKIPDTGADCLWYNPETNIFMTYRTNTTTGWFQETAAIFAAAGYDTINQRYLTAKLKNTFQAADNNDIDGRWVISHLTLIESGAISGSTIYTYDLTDYLPDDYNIYEVMLSSGATTGTTTGNVINLYVQSDIITYDVCIGRTKCISSTASPVGGSITIPIGQFRTLYIKNTSANAGTNFFANLIAYRKVR